jgi:curved DNA-binding protein CbpA
MGSKKTLYEVLNVARDASFAQIQAHHTAELQKLHSPDNGLSPEEAITHMKLVNMAFDVLKDTMSRNAYDAKLNQHSSVALQPMSPNSQALSLKVDAAALKADAAAIMAQAAMISAQSMALQHGTPHATAGLGGLAAGGFGRGLKLALTVLGALVAVGLVMMALTAGKRSAMRPDLEEETKTHEKMVIQEYYQRTGVRANSKIEVDLLEAENRRKETVLRDEQRTAEKKEREEQRFAEETRRLSERVSQDLQKDKERAERMARDEDERERREQLRMEETKQLKIEAERLRLRNERRKLGLKDE